MPNRVNIPRRTLNELEQRYRLEPTLRDLYVEGTRDKWMYEWYLKARGCTDISVFNIDSIEIDSDVLDAHGLSSGNRDRVVALALELDQRFPEPINSVRCVADSDFNFVLPNNVSADHLLYTDYTSLDLYTYNEWAISKLTVITNMGEQDIRPMLDNITPILNELFIARAASNHLKLGARFPEFLNYCTLQDGLVAFNGDDCFSNWLNSNGLASRRFEFDQIRATLRSVDISDPRMCIRGGDYFVLLGWLLRHRFGWAGYRSGRRAIQEPLSTAIDSDRLSQEILFARLERVFE